jgi:hypothetical protein
MVNYLIYLSVPAILFSAFLFEHIARKNGSNIKPSTVISFLADKSFLFWNKLGYYCAKLSSFYTYIDIKEIYQTLDDLFGPTVKLIISPYQFIKGYVDTALSYKYPILIGIGSITVVSILTLCGYNFYYGRSLLAFRSLLTRS